MKHNQRDLDEINVVGKSIFSSDDNCKICNDICHQNYHKNCLKRETPLFPSKMSLSESRAAWCLSDYHVSELHGDVARGLRGVDQLSRDLNAVRYDDCFRDGEVPGTKDGFAERFFPVTLGSSLRDCPALPITLTFSPPATGLPKQTLPWRVSTPHNRAQMRQEWLSTENYIQDSRVFLDDNPQFIRDKDAFLLQTPYQPELSRLRLERLRLEEEILMEVKRQEELERIRGPQPKWYELRDSRFHYEAKKNNELLRRSNSWQNLFDYRSDLKTKSEEFSKKFYPMNGTYDPTNYVSVS